MPTPVYVISGFLGAGKTTFINHALETAPSHLRILVLVNEFGSLAIDKQIMKTDSHNIVDLSGGCICCGLFVELMASLRFALDDFKADVILIESTGLALPREIARQALTPAFEGRLQFGGIITLVDAAATLSDAYPMVKPQIKDANVVIVNKIDLLEGRRLPALHRELGRLMSPGGSLLAATFGRVDYDRVFGRLYDHGHLNLIYERPPPVPVDSTAGFAVVSLVRHSPVPHAKLMEFYEEQRDRIIRSKGFVLTDQGALQVQFSPAGLEVQDVPGKIPRTELVLIVRTEDKDCIESQLRQVFNPAVG